MLSCSDVAESSCMYDSISKRTVSQAPVAIPLSCRLAAASTQMRRLPLSVSESMIESINVSAMNMPETARVFSGCSADRYLGNQEGRLRIGNRHALSIFAACADAEAEVGTHLFHFF